MLDSTNDGEPQLGNYRLIQEIAHSDVADVYLAEHTSLNTPAAIKVLRTELSDEEKEKFLIQASTILNLKHPHIVRILEFGIDNNIPFLVMDYAPHGTLRQRHPKGTQLPLPTIVSYV